VKAFVDTTVLLASVHADHPHYRPSRELVLSLHRRQDSSMGVIGGAIYDALIAHCALKARAEKIYTWNIHQFRQFGPEIEKRLRTP
jgi:predicted nucleic acid-binding protein